MTTQPTHPQLEAPGAGLPLGQRLVARLFIGPFVSKRAKPEEVRARYEHVTHKMLALVENMPTPLLRTRVLVDAMPGIEDSSRFWSAEQVFEHLVIVSRGVEGIILSLAAGKPLELQVSTAAVKPPGHEGALAEFKAYAPGLMQRLDQKLAAPGMDFDTPLTHEHPWFGQFSVRQWYWLLGAHQALHARHLKAILKGEGVK